VERILKALEKSTYWDNTIIVFWSDHGWHLGTKQHWHKQTLWEECTRIPFIMKVPGTTRPGFKCRRPVDMVNFFPTLLSLCGLPDLPGLDGHDMSPLLENPDTFAVPVQGKESFLFDPHEYTFINRINKNFIDGKN